MSIESIPLQTLIDDLADSVADIRVCETALALGVTHTKDGTSVQYRWDVNRRIVAVIQLELIRRRKSAINPVDDGPEQS